MGREVEALINYLFKNGTIYYCGDDTSIHEFNRAFLPQNIFHGDVPDFYVKSENLVIIVEHFEFDCYKTTRKGSEHRRELARIQRKEAAVPTDEEWSEQHEVIHGMSSYENYIQNVKRSFTEHASRIDEYINNLNKIGVITEQSLVKVMFLVEDVSPLGSAVFDRYGDESITMITLAQSKEFLDVMDAEPRVDFVLACATFDNRREAWFIEHSKLDEYYKQTVDYSSMQFLCFTPKVISWKKRLPQK